MTGLVGHFLLFAVVGVLLLVLPLLIGKLLRPNIPTREKLSIYECGEPTIGSSHIQFDLRFYVVALLFIIFDVELAFFFPWATVFGGATQLADERVAAEAPARREVSAKLLNTPAEELAAENVIPSETARRLSIVGLADILVFFGVLLVGFAYVWKRGDLDWVRAVTEKVRHAAPRPRPVAPAGEREEEAEPEPVGP